MKDMEDLKKLIMEASEDRLREIVAEWIEKDDSFCSFAKRKLNPAPCEIDFDSELSRAIGREAFALTSRHCNTNILNWSNIYHYQVKPWTDKADELPTLELMKLVVTITMRIAMNITEDDFDGDDWNGDDYSYQIQSIMGALGNSVGLLLTRKDLKAAYLAELKELMEDARANDSMSGFIDVPYDLIEELISIRKTAEEITPGMYDVLISANLDHKAGDWMCRKIDFLRSIGFNELAQETIEKIEYPEVAYKYYQELTISNQWKEAVAVLDKANALKDKHDYGNYYYGKSYDWLAIKQNLLMKYGSKEERVENLKQLFYKSYSEKGKYYRQLKEMTSENEWHDLYHELLNGISDYKMIDHIAPFLIIEGESEWLMKLIVENEAADATDYRTPLKYAKDLMPYFPEDIKSILCRTFRAYAADRFAFKKKIKSGKYCYFCDDLQKLSSVDATDLLKELVAGFRQSYSTRPSLMSELRRIKFA